MAVIAIAREFGAGGEAVGQILADRLGAEYLDKKIVAEVAMRLEMSDDEVAEADEAPGSLLTRLLTSLGSVPGEWAAPSDVTAWSPPYNDPAFDPRRAILQITQQVIREAARTGNAVIVGRGAGYLLRDEGAFSAFLWAEEAERVRVAMGIFKLDEAAARKRMKQTDANRAAYIRQVYGHDWHHPAHYDLVLDTGRLTYEGTADVILAALRSMRQ
jgi:CMP/dCMP kinase